MKPAAFEYHRPTTVEEATALLADLGHDAELLAGNQSLGIIMANRLATPDHLVDLGQVDALSGVTVGHEAVEIGAMTTHRDLEFDDDLREAVEMVPESAEQIAGPSVRNRGTVGGSVAEADPAGNYPTAFVALDADLHLTSADEERTVPAREFFVAYMFTDLGPEELVTGVTIDREPFPVERTGTAFEELKRGAQTFPTVSAATALRVDDPEAEEPTIEEARVALANVADVPLHVPDAEDALEGGPLDDGVDAAAEAAIEAADPSPEMHADEEWKEELAGEYTRRSLRTAHERATR
ncbi:FAD binding domain-containing protein [Halobacterium jilantaiense]|uniref:Carbon-monoxide dehydrogenase medium subunit n=1 Tax=Halobacterium jilantaiense TaxID=355548 RepID=A0A1I0QVC7_9EURY|nr:FAD binding domain-containing protein [Halobacterium jilantaiense]SEW31387.1 carbon-monoxide dehydrogenase medium subunit [Halobacterium jilantaiense]